MRSFWSKSLTGLRAFMAVALLGAAFSMIAVDYADARRGGGFGSRGARTFSSPAPTQTAPNRAAPVNRSMTPQQQTGPNSQANASRQGSQQQGARGGMFGGLAGGLLGGLMLGGLIGMLMGNGLGGLAGFLGLIFQIGLAVLAFVLIRRMFFSGNRGPALAGGPQPERNTTPYSAVPNTGGGGAHGAPQPHSTPPAQSTDAAQSGNGPADDIAPGAGDEIGLTGDDFDAFEQLLAEVQAAFAREDYAKLRTLCTPEIVSFLSEELSQNAVNGQRNDVTDVTLLEGDLSEAWTEGDSQYATVAMRYESVDVMRDRNTGEIVAGEQDPTETTEIWTFVRPIGGAWQLSAINDA